MPRSFTSMCPLLNEASEHEYTEWIIYQAAVFSLRICVNKWVCISAWSSPLGESLVSMEKKAKHKSSDPRRGGEGGRRGWKIVVLGQAQTLGGKVKEYSAWFLALKPGFDLYCVNLGKLLNLHVPQFLYLWKSLVCVCSNPADSLRPHRLTPAGLLCPWNFPDKNTGMGYKCLLSVCSELDTQTLLCSRLRGHS